MAKIANLDVKSRFYDLFYLIRMYDFYNSSIIIYYILYLGCEIILSFFSYNTHYINKSLIYHTN